MSEPVEVTGVWSVKFSEGPVITSDMIYLAMDALEIPKTTDNCDYFLQLVGALMIFQDRNRQYQGLFRRDGWLGSLFHMRHKFLRIWQLWRRSDDDDPKDYTDSAYDLINYIVFFLINTYNGEKFGSE